MAPLLVGESPPVLVDRILGDGGAHLPQPEREQVAGQALERALSLALDLKRLRKPMPLALGKEAGVADHERIDGAGMVAGPSQPDQPSPVVHRQRHRLQLEGAAKALQVLDLPLPGPRPAGGRVPESR